MVYCFLHGVISLPDATSYNKLCLSHLNQDMKCFQMGIKTTKNCIFSTVRTSYLGIKHMVTELKYFFSVIFQSGETILQSEETT